MPITSSQMPQQSQNHRYSVYSDFKLKKAASLHIEEA